MYLIYFKEYYFFEISCQKCIIYKNEYKFELVYIGD